MKNLLITAVIATMVFGCKDKKENAADEAGSETTTEATMAETKEEWIPLFDGTSMDQWQAYMGGPAAPYWQIEGDAMVFNPPAPELRKRADGSGNDTYNIVTKRDFTDFVLTMDWKISEAGNGGIFWGIHEDEKFREPYHSAMEIQILDNERHPDGKNGTTHQAGALYDLVAPSSDVTKPVGEWNTFVITIDHNSNRGSVVLNDVEVATFPVGGEELDALLKGSKFDGWEGFASYKTGKIGIQDHGNKVSFRNIMIKEL